MARFEREARLLASLNHPPIASTYGMVESAGIRCLVWELVEGQTLAELLGNRNSKLESRKSASGQPASFDFRISSFEPLEIAQQIAEALEAAHERGIAHPDLTPGNVKLTREGSVKVLDFGLAKALSEDAAAVGASKSPTVSEAATQQGTVMGATASRRHADCSPAYPVVQ